MFASEEKIYLFIYKILLEGYKKCSTLFSSEIQNSLDALNCLLFLYVLNIDSWECIPGQKKILFK